MAMSKPVQGQDKFIARSRIGLGKVQRQGQGNINVSNHNHNHNSNLMGFDTIVIDLVSI